MFRRMFFIYVIICGLCTSMVHGDEREIIGCGEQCMKVLCAYYNIDVSEEKLVEFLRPKQGVTSIKDLERCIRKLGLNCYAFKGNIDDVLKVPHPMIIHIKQKKTDKVGHYVILVSDEDGNLTGFDPSSTPNPIYPTLEDMEYWTGIGLVVFPDYSSINYWLCLPLIIFSVLSGSLIAHLKNKGFQMSVPSKANIDKLDNPARPKAKPRAGTELGVW